MEEKNQKSFTTLLAENFNNCKNPPNYKEAIIAAVVTLEPLSVHIDSEKNLLTEGENLLISEWFRFRCNIDKTTALSAGVPENLDSGKAITETHSYTPNNPCNMPSAISYLASAITKINTELLQLKCNLKKGDYVAICPTEISEKYIVIDKVL